MDAERWKRVEELLQSALALPPEQQLDFLREACGNDISLLEEVRSLLASHRQAGSFLESPVLSPSDTPTWTSDFSQPLPVFRPMAGETVSHYQVLNRLGSGGMGVVYEAEDVKLGRHVAMKFLPGEVTADRVAFERMQREARAASALDHPNICPIYEFGEQDGHPFIAMPLLEGQTLREWIEASRSLDDRERIRCTFDLAVQIARGLEAAHEKGIIHRDIKPANIFITSRGDAKILDFGLAKVIASAEPAPTEEAISAPDPSAPPSHLQLTRTGARMGTAYYMSPEQVRGEPLDAGTDLFSMGLVLYEMVAGRRAFAGATAEAVHDATLHSEPPSLRQISPSVPVELEKVIRRLLEKDRARRYATARELAQELERTREQIRRKRTNRRRNMAIGALVLVLVAGSIVGVRMRRVSGPSPAATPLRKARRSVAVIGFKNLSGKEEEAWISTALSEMLGAELAAGQQLRVVSGEDVARMRINLSLPAADSYGRETLIRIRQHLNSDIVAMGSYLALGKEAGGKIRVDLQLQDANDGSTITVLSRDGSENQLAELITEAGSSLRQKLGIADVVSGEISQVQAALPSTTAAARLYAEGLTKLQTFDPLTAHDLLQKAIDADPTHALSHSALAQTWSALGYDLKARDEAKRALDLGDHLSREDRLTVEARYREFSHDFPAAVEIYRTLFNFFPDRIDYGLRLANAQMRASQTQDSLATIARIHKSGLPGASDGGIDLVEAKIMQMLSRFQEEQKVAADAVKKGRAAAAPVLVAEARLQEGWAWNDLGNSDKAKAALTEARELALNRNPATAARADLYLGHVLYDRGDFDSARIAYQRSLDGSRETGDRMGTAHGLEALANVAYEQGRLDEARHDYEEELRIDREIENRLGAAAALSNLGNLLDAMGDLAGAAKTNDEALQIYREAVSKRGEATALSNLGNVLAEQGALATAKSKIEQALAIQQQIGYKRGAGFSLYSLAEIARQQDRLQDARKTAEQAIALRREIGDVSNLARSQLQLAQIAIDQGYREEALSQAKSTADIFHRLKSSDDEAATYDVISAALLETANLGDARAAATHAVSLAQKSNSRLVRLVADLTVARVDARTGNQSGATRALQSVVSDCIRYGFVELVFEARLELAQIELRSGNTAAARARLQQLQTDARDRGFILISRKAEEGLRGTSKVR